MTQQPRWKGKHYWIVGASSGLGEALSQELSNAGAILTLSARNEDRLQAIAANLTTPINIAPCDVSDTESVKSAFNKATAQTPLDGIVFCAGQYAPMTAQTWDAETAEQICDVNFTGCARILGEYLPYMTNQGSGHIALIGSLSGFKGIPGGSIYAASKAGMMHIAEGLRGDLDPELFKVQLINPGFIKTRLTDKNTFKMPLIMSPEEAAKRTLSAMETSRFQTNFPKRFAAFFQVLGLLPNFLYFPLVRKFFTT